MSTPIFYLDIRSRGCTAEIRLNDAPMFVVVREHEQQAYPTISEWVISGANLLEVDLRDIDDSPRIRVALCQANLGDLPEQGVELIVIEWPPLPAPPVEGEAPVEPALPQLPLLLSASGSAAHPWGAWAWESAPVFPANQRTTAAVIAYLRDLHARLVAGQIDVLIDESRTKFDEIAPAYELTSADAEERVRLAWAGLNSHPAFRLADLDEADLDLRLHCGGRLVEPVTLAGLPVLRQAEEIDDESWALPIFIGRTHFEYVAGRLAILR